MKISYNGKRKRIDEILDESRNVIAKKVFENLKDIDILLVEFMHPLENFGRYVCQHYVFDEIMEEDWCKIGKNVSRELYEDTMDFLNEKGYVLVDRVQDNDIVVYFETADIESSLEVNENKITHHFGVYFYERVYSKWGNGSILAHAIEDIPSEYGNEALFFRKNE